MTGWFDHALDLAHDAGWLLKWGPLHPTRNPNPRSWWVEANDYRATGQSLDDAAFAWVQHECLPTVEARP